MSNIQSKMPLEYAKSMAQALVDLLEPACTRILIAGSIRREKKLVGDIEIVCEPGLYNGPDTQFCDVDHLEVVLSCLELDGTIEKRPGPKGGTAWGSRLKRAIFYNGKDYAPVDLFIVRPPAQWAVIKAIRTGPWQFNKVLVSDTAIGGACPHDLKVAGGQVWYIGDCESNTRHALSVMPASKFLKRGPKLGARTRPIEDEEHFFSILGVPYWTPKDRTEGRLKQWLHSNPPGAIMAEGVAHKEAIKRNKEEE